MKRSIGVFIFVLFVCFITTSCLNAATKFGIVFDIEGTIEYSIDGLKWKKVKRNRYFYDGYKIRSGENSAGKIIFLKNSDVKRIGSNALLVVENNEFKMEKGALKDIEKESPLSRGLKRRFFKSQIYTTTRIDTTTDAIIIPKDCPQDSMEQFTEECLEDDLGDFSVNMKFN